MEKNPCKNGDGPIEKKPKDITKVSCFNSNDVEHYAKDWFKVRPNFEQNGSKLGPNLIMFKFTIKINVVSCVLNSRATHSFVSPSVVLQIGWKTTKIGETHQSAINQRWCEAIKWSGVGCNFGIQKNIVWRKFHGVWIRCHGGYFKQHLFKHLSSWYFEN